MFRKNLLLWWIALTTIVGLPFDAFGLIAMDDYSLSRKVAVSKVICYGTVDKLQYVNSDLNTEIAIKVNRLLKGEANWKEGEQDYVKFNIPGGPDYYPTDVIEVERGEEVLLFLIKPSNPNIARWNPWMLVPHGVIFGKAPIKEGKVGLPLAFFKEHYSFELPKELCFDWIEMALEDNKASQLLDIELRQLTQQNAPLAVKQARVRDVVEPFIQAKREAEQNQAKQEQNNKK
ncbi:hypothetical protein HYR99_38465 [Candidatus Poribacteria bacterium]|nr:hypothetical protein [Candidatus Poribacteria bacterium]